MGRKRRAGDDPGVDSGLACRPYTAQSLGEVNRRGGGDYANAENIMTTELQCTRLAVSELGLIDAPLGVAEAILSSPPPWFMGVLQDLALPENARRSKREEEEPEHEEPAGDDDAEEEEVEDGEEQEFEEEEEEEEEDEDIDDDFEDDDFDDEEEDEDEDEDYDDDYDDDDDDDDDDDFDDEE